MKNKSKNGLLIAFVLFCIAGMHSEPRLSVPKKNQVVVIGRIVLTPPIDVAYYKKTYKKLKADIAPVVKLNNDSDLAHISSACLKGVPLDDFFFITYELEADEKSVQESEAIFVKSIADKEMRRKVKEKLADPNRPPVRDRELVFDGVKVVLFGDDLMAKYLPLEGTFYVEDGVQYVYIGSYFYEFENFGTTFKDVTEVDEYDQAKAALNTLLGGDNELIRAKLTPRVFDQSILDIVSGKAGS